VAANVENAPSKSSPEKIREDARVLLRQIIKRELDKKPVIEIHVIKAAA